MCNLNKIIIIWALILAVFSAVSCGEDEPVFLAQDLGPSTGLVKAIISGARSFNPSISHGKIVQYKITVSGEGFETIEAIFDGDAESGVIDGVPSGVNRLVHVEAINQNNVKIRDGEAIADVEPSVITNVSIKMESVPIFVNLADGNVIPNTQLVVKVFADPSSTVIVDDDFEGVELPLLDISTAQTEIVPDISTGLAKISPPLLPEGTHVLTVRNNSTGLASSISIRLTDGEKLKPAPTVGAVSAQPAEISGGAL